MRVNLVIGEGRPPLIARRLEQGCGDRDREEQAGVAPAAHPPHAAVGRAAPPENELRHHRDDSREDHRPAEPYTPGGEPEGGRDGRKEEARGGKGGGDQWDSRVTAEHETKK